jgi:hypothetical protein
VDIIPTNEDFFDRLESCTMGEPRRIGPDLIAQRLEEIDETIFRKKPEWLHPVSIDKLPGAGFTRENADKALRLTLARANGEKVRVGFVNELFEIPEIGPNPLGGLDSMMRYDIDKSQYQDWQRKILTAIEYGLNPIV